MIKLLLIMSCFLVVVAATTSSVKVNYTANLRGDLVPTQYQKRPYEAYGCFYGLTFMDCSCYNPKLKPSQGCYGPKCFSIDETPQQTYYKNYTCSITNSRLVDCSQNESQNIYLFTNCSNVPNVSRTLDLYDYEFRFDSIELNREHKVVTCPLPRIYEYGRMYLYGYVLNVRVHVHRVKSDFAYEWVTQILSCNVQKVIEYEQPIPVGALFQQLIQIESV
jgi:hypothetical protein